MRRENYTEYVPLIENHLIAIIDKPEVHRWKVYDAIEFLTDFNSDFIASLLKDKNKSIDDYRPGT